MNSKKLNIVLIAIVVAVWGVIIYKYFIQNSENPINMNSISLIEKKDFVNYERKTFELVKLKRDPFLGKTYVPQNNAKKSTTSNKVKQKVKYSRKKNKTVYEPKIEYLGFIKNKKNPKKMVILKVGGKTQILKEGTDFKSLFYIKKAHQDSVELIINKITKVYKKEK